jgi:hypothetical protein
MMKRMSRFFFCSTGIIKPSTTPKDNYYDTPKIYHTDENIISKSTCLVTNGNVNEQSNNNNTITNLKVNMHSLDDDFSSFSSYIYLFFFLAYI